MTNKIIVKNSVVAGKKPATAATNKVGELWVNPTDKIVGTFDASGAAVELAPPVIPLHDPAKGYVAGDMVVHNHKIYRLRTGTVAPGGFNENFWDVIADNVQVFTTAGGRPAPGGRPGDLWVNIVDKKFGTFDASNIALDIGGGTNSPALGQPPAYSTATTHPAGSYTTYNGKTYRATTTVPAGTPFNPANWVQEDHKLMVGSVPYADANGALTDDPTSLKWDYINKRLSVGQISIPNGPTVDSNGLHMGTAADAAHPQQAAMNVQPGSLSTTAGDQGAIMHLINAHPGGSVDFIGYMAFYKGPNGIPDLVGNIHTDTAGDFKICGDNGHELHLTITQRTGPVSRDVFRINGGGAIGVNCPGNLGGGMTITSTDGAFPLALANSFKPALFWTVGPGWQHDDAFRVNPNGGGAAGPGCMLASNSAAWASASDERLKNIFEPIENATEKVKSLRAVIGAYKKDPDQKRTPFLIAQDVEKVLPEAVYEDGNKDMMLEYTAVIPLLVAAIKEQAAEIVALKKALEK
jgi:hypothetical protein